MGIPPKEIHVSTVTNAVICSKEQYDYPPLVVFVSLPAQVDDETKPGEKKTVGEVHTYACMTHLSPELKQQVRSELSDVREKIEMARRADSQAQARAAITVQEMPFDKPAGYDSWTEEKKKEYLENQRAMKQSKLILPS